MVNSMVNSMRMGERDVGRNDGGRSGRNLFCTVTPPRLSEPSCTMRCTGRYDTEICGDVNFLLSIDSQIPMRPNSRPDEDEDVCIWHVTDLAGANHPLM